MLLYYNVQKSLGRTQSAIVVNGPADPQAIHLFGILLK